MLTLQERTELLTLIKATKADDSEWVRFESIRRHSPVERTPQEWAELLCYLLHHRQLKAEDRKQEGKGLFIALTASAEGSEREFCDWSEEIGAALQICQGLCRPKSLREFHRLTSSRYRKLTLMKFLDQSKASLLDLQVICRYVEAFFANELPFSLYDLNLGKQALLDIQERIASNSFLPEVQDLIRLQGDRHAIWFENMPSPRLFKLLRNKKVPIIKVLRKQQRGLLTELRSQDLAPIDLFYNTAEQRLFDNLKRLLRGRPAQADGAISVLLYGPSGTGKTAFVLQLAKEVGADVLQLNFDAITSKWVGETQKNIQAVFDTYHSRRLESERPVFLLLNEADALMNRRVEVSRSNDGFHNQNQAQLLQVLEDFQGIVFATTNLFKNLDEAFHRRFLFHQELRLPDWETREKLLTHSPLHPLVSGQLRQALLEAVWSPADLKNAEQKVKMLGNLYDVWEEGVLEQLLRDSGLLKEQRRLGFSTRNTRPIALNCEEYAVGFEV